MPALPLGTLRTRLVASAIVGTLVLGSLLGATAYALVRSDAWSDVDRALSQRVERGAVRELVRPGGFFEQQGRRDGPHSPGGRFDDGVNTELRGTVALLRTTDGTIVAATAGADELASEFSLSSGAGRRSFDTHRVDGIAWRVLTVQLADGWLQLAAPAQDVQASLRRTALLLTILILLAAISAGILALRLATSALAPVAEMAEDARQLGMNPRKGARVAAVHADDELVDLRDSFNTLLAGLDAMLESQQRFVSDAAHELKTPLSAVVGYLELAERTDDVNDMRDLVRDAQRNADRLHRIAQSLLALSRLDEPKRISRADMRLAPLAHEAARTCAHAWPQHIIEVAVDDACSALIDEPLFTTALQAVVENACTHTPPGTSVRISAIMDEARTTLTITDDGPGISAEDLPTVFQRFQRGASTQDTPGSGLGLAIAQAAIESQNGTISVDSPNGGGTTVTIMLEACRYDDESRAAQPAERSQ